MKILALTILLSAIHFNSLIEHNNQAGSANHDQSKADHNNQSEESPRIKSLRSQLAAGDHQALKHFWESITIEHAPILESIPGAKEETLVTFVWRGSDGTSNVSVAGREMLRLMDTDLWYLTLAMNRNIPIFYSFFPTINGKSTEKMADPLNPNRFIVPAAVQEAIPLDLKMRQSEWLESSILLFKEFPSSRWVKQQPSISAGTVKMFNLEDKKNNKPRRVWVYKPPGYNPKSREAYKLLICFDGLSYLNEIPVPTILDNLLAADKIQPTIAVMIENGNAKESAEDLDNHATFADFIGKDLISWIRKNWPVSADPRNTILCGYSRGGLAAAYISWKYPQVFGNVLSQSGAFWRGNEGGSADAEWLTQQFNNSQSANLKLYIEVGGEETGRTPNGKVFIESNRRLQQVLQSKGYQIKYIEVKGARHDPIHWQLQFPDGLIWLAGKS